MRALIIDDSRAMRTIITRIITGLGFEVSQAGDGKQGLDTLRALPAQPDVVLVDWNMPEMTGIEFVRAMRADASFAGVKVVMVTTEAEMSRVGEALDAGANEYVMKPFTPEIMVDKLRMLGLAGLA
jgi:two-component system, chemotaxis family, chemotaxis protein CheY